MTRLLHPCLRSVWLAFWLALVSLPAWAQVPADGSAPSAGALAPAGLPGAPGGVTADPFGTPEPRRLSEEEMRMCQRQPPYVREAAAEGVRSASSDPCDDARYYAAASALSGR